MSLAGSPLAQAGGPWLLGDVGGTNARFAALDADGTLGPLKRLCNAEFADLAAVLRQALGSADATARVGLAVAAPVTARAPVRLTNLDWSFDARSLRLAIQAAEVWLLNDFAAVAAGLDALLDHESSPIGVAAQATAPSEAARPGVAIVLGPGTGLGLATAVRCGDRVRVLESEAGHAGCASAWPDIQPALQRARERFGRASWERLLSGAGLALIDAALRQDAPRAPATVAAAAQAGEPDALRAARAFSRLLGEFAGDACLVLRADAVWLTGGVLDGLGGAFDGELFRAGFEDKGRFSSMLRGVPTRLVRAPDLAMRGLARVVCGEVDVPGLQRDDAAAARPAADAVAQQRL